MKRIEHLSDLPAYAPPGHSRTRNVRLVERDFCGSFEMILGELEPGGTADPHDHADEHQIIFVLDGECEVTLGDDPMQVCGPGTVIRIPPRVMHAVKVIGERTLKLIVLYSPPLQSRAEDPMPPMKKASA